MEKIEGITAQKIKEETKPQTGLVRALGVANITFMYHFACFWTLREIIDPQTDSANEGIAYDVYIALLNSPQQEKYLPK